MQWLGAEDNIALVLILNNINIQMDSLSPDRSKGIHTWDGAMMSSY